MIISKLLPSLTRKVKKLLSVFFKGRTDPTLLLKSNPQNSKKSSQSNLYHHCSELPLDNFIDALVNKNYFRIIKFGNATRAEVEAAWQKILYEYYDLSGTKSYRSMFAINKEILQLQARMLSIHTCLAVLENNPDTECERILKGMGYNYSFNRENQEEYQKTIQNIAKRSKTVQVAIDMKLAEKNKIEKGFKGAQPTENDFRKNLVELSKYMGFRIKSSEITVSEYVAIMNKYNEEAEHIASIKAK